MKVGRHVARLMRLPRSLRERKHYKRVFLGKYYDKELRVPHAALLFRSAEQALSSAGDPHGKLRGMLLLLPLENADASENTLKAKFSYLL